MMPWDVNLEELKKSLLFIAPLQLCLCFHEHFIILLLAIISEDIFVGSVLIIPFCLMSLNLAFGH